MKLLPYLCAQENVCHVHFLCYHIKVEKSLDEDTDGTFGRTGL